MTHTHSRLARRLLAGVAAMTLAATMVGAANASDLGQQTVSNRQTLDQTRGEDGPSERPSTATADGLYTVQTGGAATSSSALALDGNQQSAKIAGNAASSTLTATAVRAGDRYDPVPFAVLSNRQTADGMLKARSNMAVSVSGEIGESSVTLSNNANSALARMNDAANTVSVEAIDLAGDTRLTSVQRASGGVAATAVSHVGIGDTHAGLESSRLTVQDNSTASEATANRAINDLAVTSVTGLGGTPVLFNKQGNDAGVLSTTKATYAVSGRGAYGSAISIEGNTTSSLARGNVADNLLAVSTGAGNGDQGDGETPMVALLSLTNPPAGAVLANRQVNMGGVTAKTDTYAGVALNCGCTDDGRISVASNSGVSSAYGNAALNTATAEGAGQPLVLVSNMQVNRGPVSANVTGRFGTATGGVNASLISVSGNSLAATAIGNQAVNTLTVTR